MLAFVLLSFLAAINWHVEGYNYADLSALARLSAFLDMWVLTCVNADENTMDFYNGSAVLNLYWLCRLPNGRVNFLSLAFFLPITSLKRSIHDSIGLNQPFRM